MYCKNCGSLLNDNQSVCLDCGVKVGNGNKYCQHCGCSVHPEQDVCLSCGAELKTAPKSCIPANKDKTIAVILCLFFGCLGVHSFYLGETKKGLFRLLMTFCCGIGELLALVDLVLMLIGSYNYNPDTYLF